MSIIGNKSSLGKISIKTKNRANLLKNMLSN